MVAEVLDPKLKSYEGKTIAAIAAAEKKDPRDVVIDLVLADRANAGCIISIMDEKDVRAALASPIVSFGTDSRPRPPTDPSRDETSHPRGWGSAARILGYYVREEKVLRLEEAIRKMTSFAAEAAGHPESRPRQARLRRRPRCSSTRRPSAPPRPSKAPTATARASATSPSTACSSWTTGRSPARRRAAPCGVLAT